MSKNAWANFGEAFGVGAEAIGMAGARSALVRDWTSGFYNIAGFTAPPYILADITTPQKKKRKTGRKIKRVVKADESKATDEKETAKTDEGKLDSYNVTENQKMTLSKNMLSGGKEEEIDEEEEYFEENYVTHLGFGFNAQASGMNIVIDQALSDTPLQNAEIALQNMSYGYLNLGFILDLRHIVKMPQGLPLSFGGTVFLNNGGLVNVNEVSQKSYNFKRIGGNVRHLGAMLGISSQPIRDRLSIGLGINTLASGNIEVLAKDISATAPDPGLPQVDLINSTSIALSPRLLFGAIYMHPLSQRDSIFVSLNYRQDIMLNLDVDVLATGIPYLGNTTIHAQSSVLNMYSPHTFTLGAAYVKYRWRFALDLEYQLWSLFELSKTRELFENPPQFDDGFSARLGVDFPIVIPVLKKHFFRGRFGYGFSSAVTPDQIYDSNYLDNGKNIFAIGLSYFLATNEVVTTPTKIDLGIQYQWWVSRETVKEISDDLQPNYSYGGGVFVIGLSFSWKF